MGKFIQYDINEILPTLKEFIEKVEFEKKYTKDELFDLYKQIKSYETGKTKQIFSNILNRILFGNIKKNEKKSMNPLGILIKKNPSKENLMIETIYLDLYNNTDIFRIECDSLSEYLNKRGNFSYTKENFEEFIFARVERFLEEAPEYKDNLKNTRNKMFRTVKNLVLLGTIKEQEETHIMESFRPDWKLVAYLLIIEFESKKVMIDKLKKSKFKKTFFISDYDLEDYLEKLQLEGIIIIERRSGLSQININITDPYELVRIIADR